MAANEDWTRAPSALAAGLLGALLGLAWAAALRGYMTQLVPVSQLEWFGTFVGVLLPGLVIGGLLGIAWVRGRSGRTAGLRWFALAPLAFLALLLQPGAVTTLLTTGVGGAAPAFAVMATVGGFALSGRGRPWARLLCGALALVFVAGLVLAGPIVGGTRLALTTPRGAWVAVLVGSLGVVLMLAASIPFRFAGRSVGSDQRGPGVTTPSS